MLPHPGPYQIPQQTAAVARAAFPKGTLAMRLADSLGVLYEEADFAALYPATGVPEQDPVRLARVECPAIPGGPLGSPGGRCRSRAN